MFTEGDNLVDSVNDDFILDYVIPVFSKYSFLGTRIDALGAVYEVLALRVLNALRDCYRTVLLADICREPIIRGEQPEYDDFGEVR